MSIFIFCTNVNRNPTDATVCRYLFTAKLLYMFRVSQHPSSGVLKTVPSASGTGHTTTATPLRRGLIGTQSRSDHVSDINTSIIRNLRLFCWITTSVVLFLVRCVLEFRCGWVGLVSVLQAYFTSYALNMFRTLMYPSSGACDYSVELPHRSYCSWFDVCRSFGVVGLDWYPCCRLISLLMRSTCFGH